MLKVAILDDYQNVSQQFVDLEKLSGKYEIKIFSEPFEDEADALDKLADFEALLIMRERTPITKNLIENLSKLKFIITSGLKNNSIDLDVAKKEKILVSRCKTSPSQAVAELVLSLFLNLSRKIIDMNNDLKPDIWHKRMGNLLSGKVVGVIGLGEIGKRFKSCIDEIFTTHNDVYCFSRYLGWTVSNSICR